MHNSDTAETGQVNQLKKHATGMLKDMTISLLVISGVYAMMSFASSIVILWEGTITAVLALILIRTYSRGAALLLIVMSLIAISNGFVTVIGAVDLGTRNIPLGFISLWCAWRSLQNTMILRGKLTLADFGI